MSYSKVVLEAVRRCLCFGIGILMLRNLLRSSRIYPRLTEQIFQFAFSDAFMEAVKKDGDWDLVSDLDDPNMMQNRSRETDQWKKLGGRVKVL